MGLGFEKDVRFRTQSVRHRTVFSERVFRLFPVNQQDEILARVLMA